MHTKDCHKRFPILQPEIHPIENLIEIGCDVVKYWVLFQKAMKGCPNMQVLHQPVGCGGKCSCKDKDV